ncbi:carbohydrate sulfotransferase 14-like [Hypanus sabinus]|uniref:carbohydrate sulfotransferase 14-like n=1 Tax=Hypanus sabinus TaxID=79690 RepID=UPI0028C4B954|nr:carbohydrate sulfotransferase 14-like [Hypanus sabinus]
MGLPRRHSAVLLLLGVLVWLLCTEWRAGRSSALGKGPTLSVESNPLTFDPFLYNQQLRRMLLRSFCKQGAEANRPHQIAHFQSLRANARHRVVYCSSPDTGTAYWERVLEILNNVPVEESMLVSESTPPTLPHGDLSWKDMDTTATLPPSYTKIIFIRHPLQRLLFTYHHDHFVGESLEAYVQRVLPRGMAEEPAGCRPLVHLCQPCLIQYDYVVAYKFLDQELGHLLWRLGFRPPEGLKLPPFQDWEESLWSQWLVEQFLGHLPAWLLDNLLQLYSGDFSAFNFTHELTLN